MDKPTSGSNTLPDLEMHVTTDINGRDRHYLIGENKKKIQITGEEFDEYSPRALITHSSVLKDLVRVEEVSSTSANTEPLAPPSPLHESTNDVSENEELPPPIATNVEPPKSNDRLPRFPEDEKTIDTSLSKEDGSTYTYGEAVAEAMQIMQKLKNIDTTGKTPQQIRREYEALEDELLKLDFYIAKADGIAENEYDQRRDATLKALNPVRDTYNLPDRSHADWDAPEAGSQTLYFPEFDKALRKQDGSVYTYDEAVAKCDELFDQLRTLDTTNKSPEQIKKEIVRLEERLYKFDMFIAQSEGLTPDEYRDRRDYIQTVLRDAKAPHEADADAKLHERLYNDVVAEYGKHVSKIKAFLETEGRENILKDAEKKKEYMSMLLAFNRIVALESRISNRGDDELTEDVRAEFLNSDTSVLYDYGVRHQELVDAGIIDVSVADPAQLSSEQLREQNAQDLQSLHALLKKERQSRLSAEEKTEKSALYDRIVAQNKFDIYRGTNPGSLSHREAKQKEKNLEWRLQTLDSLVAGKSTLEKDSNGKMHIVTWEERKKARAVEAKAEKKKAKKTKPVPVASHSYTPAPNSQLKSLNWSKVDKKTSVKDGQRGVDALFSGIAPLNKVGAELREARTPRSSKEKSRRVKLALAGAGVLAALGLSMMAEGDNVNSQDVAPVTVDDTSNSQSRRYVSTTYEAKAESTSTDSTGTQKETTKPGDKKADTPQLESESVGTGVGGAKTSEMDTEAIELTAEQISNLENEDLSQYEHPWDWTQAHDLNIRQMVEQAQAKGYNFSWDLQSASDRDDILLYEGNDDTDDVIRALIESLK